MKQETLKLIEELAKEHSHDLSERIDFRIGAKAALTNPAILESEGLSRNEWISVEDEPKESGMYLCYDLNSPTKSKYEIYYFNKRTKNWTVGMDTYHPQFYQPLPTPPKNDKQ
jgi:hypothetical protein